MVSLNLFSTSPIHSRINHAISKNLISFTLIFLSYCIAEENGAYASVGFEYSISHAVEHNNPFLNQERIQIIS
ncbi:hypothetical protein C2R93_03295, partial [Helicobacter pylori]